MIRKRMGKTGEDVSGLILGGWLFGGTNWGEVDDAESIRTIHAAIDAGIDMIDTAEGYAGGHSEEVIGKALTGRSGQMRIATKVSPSNLAREDLFAALERSLGRLQVDCIDLYQVHWPNDSVPISETMEALAECVQQGKIRAIGVSNFSAAQMAEALEIARIDSLQPPYSLFWRHVEAAELPFCESNGIAVIPYSPMAQGLLTGKFNIDSKFDEGDIRLQNMLFKGETYRVACAGVDEMRTMAEGLGCPVAHLALAWLIAQPSVTAPIVGARNAEQVLGVVGATDVRLSEEQLGTLTSIGDRVMATLDDSPVMWR